LSRLPIRLRVTLVFCGVMAVVLAGTGLFLYLRLESQLNRDIDQDLHSRADQLTALIRASDAPGLGESVHSVLARQRESFAQIVTRSGRIFAPRTQPGRSVLAAAELERARRGTVMFERSDLPGLGGDPARLQASPVRQEEGRRLIVVVGASLASRDETLGNLATLLLIGGPVALLLASLAAYGATRAALRPVDAMRRRAAEISAADAEQRLPLSPAQDEVRRLGETLNRMLDRLQAAVERERAFVDDASHELRTPLALHKTELELALRYGGSTEELRRAIASAIEEANRISQLAEDLLVLARSDKGALSIQAKPVQVRDLFSAVRGRLDGPAREAGRSLVVDDPDGLVIEADCARVEQALANLVENGLRHGNGEIRVWARATDGGVELHVTDDGPGFPPDFLPHAFERFRRVDTARAEGGTGLGLAIVDAIAQAHSGRAAARNVPEGGADVWIELGRVG
jgi:two-component system OmpR family sensor kinase